MQDNDQLHQLFLINKMVTIARWNYLETAIASMEDPRMFVPPWIEKQRCGL